MSAKPVFGYPSRTAAAVALAAEDYGPAEIADMIGGTKSDVQALLCNAERRARRVGPRAEAVPPKARPAPARRQAQALPQPTAKPGLQYRLRFPGGAFLNIDGSGTVDGTHYAWIGSREAAGAMKRESRIAAGMTLVPVDPWERRDRVFEMEMVR